MRTVFAVWYETVARVVFVLPRFRSTNALKATFLRALGAKIGRRVTFYQGVFIVPPRGLILGDDVDLAVGVLVSASGGVTIGDRAFVGHRAQIISANHAVRGREPIFGSGHERAPVVIGRDSWIGANAVVLPGVRVGEGAVVAAGAVVTRDVPEFTIVAGVPAREIRTRS